MVDLGTAGGATDVYVTGLTDAGMIVGSRVVSTDPSLFRARPFLHTGLCGFRDLPMPSGPDVSGFANAVDDRGVIYGAVLEVFNEPYRVFSWVPDRRPC
jgi:hypothetical protein